ncbi:hypothetical protein [Mycobacterium aquaticum]|uniref:Uncharacterized protein n=1 Tax=Mycobacterium aquaticum TaxID=1927124 RepID=A0A1X0A003_9MYCO|nr:hypothetical protein [Mycobacterium aquaticum]ORA23401.1 hypothetical protein BST13_35195 [Mycobacterium aquaticum]
MAYTINPDVTLIPDKAEVWLKLAADVADINTMIPATPDADLEVLGWLFSGLLDDKKGIPLNPSIEKKEYDGFGHPLFRVKLKKGKLETGFTVLEDNAVTRKVVLPGSAPNKIGAPKNVQIYVLYRVVDEDTLQGKRVWVQLTPAPVETKSHGGFIEGELSFAELTVHHTQDANGDVFQVVDASSDDVVKTFTIAAGVTAYTATAGADTTASITTKTANALQTALRGLASVQALPAPGVTVEGPSGGPLVATFTGPITPVSAAGTGGTVTVD